MRDQAAPASWQNTYLKAVVSLCTVATCQLQLKTTNAKTAGPVGILKLRMFHMVNTRRVMAHNYCIDVNGLSNKLKHQAPQGTSRKLQAPSYRFQAQATGYKLPDHVPWKKFYGARTEASTKINVL